VTTGVPSADSAGLSTLEQVNAPYCQTKGRPYLKGINETEKKAVFFRPRCKLWTCPTCADINKKLWAVKAYHAVEILSGSSPSVNFLTITSHEKLSAAASLAVWPKAWSKLSQRARRRSADFQFLLVPEQHKDGRLHIHAIETAGLGSRWWKDHARACGLGYMAEEDDIRGAAGAAYYVTKYLSKSLAADVWPKGFRRVRTSQRWPKLPHAPLPEGWSFTPLEHDEPLNRTITILEHKGYDVLVLDHIEAWEAIKFQED